MKTFNEHMQMLDEKTKQVVQRRSVPNSGKFYYGAMYNSTPDATHNSTPDAPVGGTVG